MRKLSQVEVKSYTLELAQDLHLGPNFASKSKEDRFYLQDACPLRSVSIGWALKVVFGGGGDWFCIISLNY